MEQHIISLMPSAPGVQHSLQVLRFGVGLPGPKAYVQAALHADEAPAMVVAHALIQRLQQAEETRSLRGEVVVVPYANPIGLAQIQLGQQEGRFDLQDGLNFNRGYAVLHDLVSDDLASTLTQNPEHNVARIRRAFREALGQLRCNSTTQDLKKNLMGLAMEADVVLDLHCDTDAVVHLYGLTSQQEDLQELGRWFGAQALLTAAESGDHPFDEACSRPWLVLQQRHPQHPIPSACFAATVELRGERDTDFALAAADAQAIMSFLAQRGVWHCDDLPPPPPPRCEPTPLSASEPLMAPHAGVIVFHHAPGEWVTAGTIMADILDPATGRTTAVRCVSDGLFYARCSQRWATPGKRLGKIAGRTMQRRGKLLSP